MDKKFITLHNAPDNAAIIINSEVVVLATRSIFGGTALVTVGNAAIFDKHTYFVNESVERVKAVLSEAGVQTVLVHGHNSNDEILITVDSIFSITETRKLSNGKKTAGSTIALRYDFVNTIECNETHAKITSQL